MTAWFADGHDYKAIAPVFQQSRVALSLADATQADMPLIAVNAKFCDMTGYTPEAVLGRNCRFLQPKDGAGPVRQRMRSYLEDPAARQARFILPNLRRTGERFINLVYMAKLVRGGKVRAVLGSQFEVRGGNHDRAAAYDRALSEDLQRMDQTLREDDEVLLGGYHALASSLSVIAQSKLDLDG